MPQDIWIWIDPTSQCNLACGLCYTKDSHRNVQLSLPTLRAILDKLLQPSLRLRMVHLNWRGEPLINPEFPALLECTLSTLQATALHWHTNGTLLTRRAKEIVAASVSENFAYVSIDGGNQTTHEANRGVATFRRSLAGLRSLIDAESRQPVEGSVISVRPRPAYERVRR